jgi:hypothetical protein
MDDDMLAVAGGCIASMAVGFLAGIFLFSDFPCAAVSCQTKEQLEYKGKVYRVVIDTAATDSLHVWRNK